MEVETYECQEAAAEPTRRGKRRGNLIEKLGLEGQKRLTTKTEAGMDTRCPYREMTRDENKYAHSPVPLRVLQIASHAMDLGLFRECVVWHATSAVEPDPILVGRFIDSNNPDYEWYDKQFILARWAESLETFVVLLRQACEHKRRDLADQVRAAGRNIQQLAGAAEGMTDAQVVACGADAKVEITLPKWN